MQKYKCVEFRGNSGFSESDTDTCKNVCDILIKHDHNHFNKYGRIEIITKNRSIYLCEKNKIINLHNHGRFVSFTVVSNCTMMNYIINLSNTDDPIELISIINDDFVIDKYFAPLSRSTNDRNCVGMGANGIKVGSL